MKTTPTLQSPASPATAITRATAASHLRRERGQGKVLKVSRNGGLPRLPSGYLLVSQNQFLVSPKPPPPFVPQPFSLAVRLTHKYVTGWSHLDRQHDLGEATLVAVKPARWDSHGESYRQLQLVRVPQSSYRVRNIIRALYDSMQDGCRCEHDCCGHVQTSVSKVRALCPGLFAVSVHGCRNI